MRILLEGYDPGIVDTGWVGVFIDTAHRSIVTRSKVWTKVSTIKDKIMTINQTFLSEVAAQADIAGQVMVDHRLVGVEGYRPRGKNIRQDQQMTDMVVAINRARKGSQVVDNTGLKRIVKPGLMDLFSDEFPKTHHADLESALRVALKLGIDDDRVNPILADVALAAYGGSPWAHANG